MQLLFVDESGSPPARGQAEPRYFVVGGVIIPDGSWHRVRDALLGLKLRLKVRGELKWRYFSPSNDDKANPMRGMAQAEKDAIRRALYALLVKDGSIRCIACVCSIKAAYAMASIQSPDDVYHATYKPVTERFQYFLQDQSKATGRKENGVIVSDNRGPRSDRLLRDHHQKLLYARAGHISRYSHLVEGLFLQPSNLSVGIQLADLVAGAVWRSFERGDERWLDLLQPVMRRGPTGSVEGYGIVKFPKAGWM